MIACLLRQGRAKRKLNAQARAVLPVRRASCIAGLLSEQFERLGHVAEWLRSGLQNRLRRFNSGRGLHSFYIAL